MKPYYQDDYCTIYHGDCREILPTLQKVDLCLTDPPYGINRDRGMGGRGFDGFGRGAKRNPKKYTGGWDSDRPERETMELFLSHAQNSVVWGGNYFADNRRQINVEGKSKLLEFAADHSAPDFRKRDAAAAALAKIESIKAHNRMCK